ncbi:MAG: hypothetical protein H0T91_03090, partial [Propionibacteriaceae bacterium]|nr:hypothetical protein [Propionibacteriaceae bacterium]
MVGKESEEYRPRRALSYDPAADPDDAPTAVGGGSPTADPEDEERKPLYRDEVNQAQFPTHVFSSPSVSTPDVGAGQEEPEVRTRIVAGAGGRPRGRDEATQILPRTPRSSYADSRSDFDPAEDDLDGADAERTPLGRRTRMALLVAAVAAVVIVGLVIGYLALALGDNPTASPRPAPSVPVGSAGPASSADPASPSHSDPGVVLTDDSMLSATEAKRIDGARSWKVTLTQRGREDDSPHPACLGPDVLEGQPASQQTVLRRLSSTGTTAPDALHQADAYPTPEEASQAYELAAKALGGCLMTGAYIDSGQAISGLGDQAVGVTVNVVADSETEVHSVLLNRTGRVINVIDAAQQGTAVSTDGLAKALAQVTNAQCKT